MAKRAKKNTASVERRSKLRHDGSSSSHPPPPPVVEPAADMPFGYLFQYDPSAHERFVTHFMQRKICKPKVLDSAFFTRESFEIVTLLTEAHLLTLAEMECPYSPLMVQAFYQSLRYVDGDLTSRVCGIDIVMTALVWTEILGYDFDSVADAVEYDGDCHYVFHDYRREEIVAETRRPDAELGQFGQYPVGYLSIPARILHYVCTHIIFQRPHNHSKVLESDFVLLWAILHQKKVN